MKKKANQPSYWNKMEGDLRKIQNLPSSVHSLLGSDKLKWHQSLPAGVAPNAKAYVTTEDTNDDGDIETINLVVTNIEKEWPKDILSKINQMDQNDPVYRDMLDGVAKMLIHELAHIDDHKDGDFPGGEGVAESRENAFTSSFATASITNADNKVISPLELSKNGDIKMKKEIINLATHLDKLGHSDLADRLDAILKSAEHDFFLDAAADGATDNELLQAENVEDVDGDAAIAAVESGGVDLGDSDPALDFASTASTDRIGKMAELISKEFSLTSRGNVNRG